MQYDDLVIAQPGSPIRGDLPSTHTITTEEASNAAEPGVETSWGTHTGPTDPQLPSNSPEGQLAVLSSAHQTIA